MSISDIDEDVTQLSDLEESCHPSEYDWEEIISIITNERVNGGLDQEPDSEPDRNDRNVEEDEGESDNEEIGKEMKNESGLLTTIAKTIGIFCFISCPPVPEIITRKMAFHPPARTYDVYLDDIPDKKITSAKRLRGKNFSIHAHPLEDREEEDYSAIRDQCTPFTVLTREKNTLIGVHFKSNRKPSLDDECAGALNNQVIIFAQPNSSDLGAFMHPQSVNFAVLSNFLNMDIYAFDYSGYGLSSGHPSEKNVYADIHAVYDYVRNERPDKKICLLGYSIGTTVVTDLASLEPDRLSGVILIAPFTSGIRLMWNVPSQEKSCCLDRFKSADKITDVNVPVLIIHGSDDRMITMEHSQQLHRRLKHPVTPLFVHGADHTTIFNGTHKQTFNRIMRFLRMETFAMK